MRITVFYFSGTGNTPWAVRHFCRLLTERGCQAAMVSLEDVAANDDNSLDKAITESDILGLANPIYGATIPGIMREFIARIAGRLAAAGGGTKAVCWLNTFGYVNGFGPFCARNLLSGAGMRLVAYVNVRMCNNAFTPKTRTGVVTPEKLAGRKRMALSVMKKAAERVSRGKQYISGRGPYLLAGIFIRKASSPALAASFREMGVVTDKCAYCMVCVNNCPTGSIHFNDGLFTFDPTCTACFRCYNFCPNAAVTVNGVFADPEIYQRYQGPGAEC